MTLWLRSWHTSTHAQYIISVVGLVLLAVAAEGLAAMRARCVPLCLCALPDLGLGNERVCLFGVAGECGLVRGTGRCSSACGPILTTPTAGITFTLPAFSGCRERRRRPAAPAAATPSGPMTQE